MRGLQASWVVVGDGESSPIKDGAVIVADDGRIVSIGRAGDLRQTHADAAWESHDAVLLPGLVNAHTHLELSALRGLVPGGKGFVPWAEDMIAKRRAAGVDDDAEAIGHAVSELLAFGTAAVGDVSNSLAPVAALSGMPILARVFAEVFGVRREVAEAMKRVAEERLAELGALPHNVTVTFAAHTPFTVHPDVLAAIAKAAHDNGTLSTLHLAEHAAERAFLRDGSGPFREMLVAMKSDSPDWEPPGIDPVRYAKARGALGPHVLAVHLTDAHDDELAVVAESGAPVVLCPRSNLHIELRLPPLDTILARGIRPALGTDSLASSPDLDVLGEARALRTRFPNVRPRALVAMATGWGADALRVARRVGRLHPGLTPGIVALAHPQGAPPEDPEAFALSPHAKERRVLVRPGNTFAQG